MRNRVKEAFWSLAFLIIVLEILIVANKQWEKAAWLGLAFQGACLVFMREDVK